MNTVPRSALILGLAGSLPFLWGALWWFAAKASGRTATAGYVLSVIPALWALFMTGGGPTTAAMNRIVGFLALLMLDWHFWRLDLAPPWWMHLRTLLTVIVCFSLLPVVI